MTFKTIYECLRINRKVDSIILYLVKCEFKVIIMLIIENNIHNISVGSFEINGMHSNTIEAK